MSDEFPINKRVRQGHPLSCKLFTAVMEDVFEKADIFAGINVNGENLTNLTFADDVALFNEKKKKKKKKNTKQTTKQNKTKKKGGGGNI